jgi:hypothetical protein
MLTIIGCVKVGADDAQQYTLTITDIEKAKTDKGYMFRTETGTKEELRAMMKRGNVTDADADNMFAQAK